MLEAHFIILMAGIEVYFHYLCSTEFNTTTINIASHNLI